MTDDTTLLGEACEPARARRSGGRQARVAMRAAPLADDVKPVRPGLPGGQYKPLTEASVGQIHAAALDALEQIGLSQAPPSTKSRGSTRPWRPAESSWARPSAT